MSKQAVGYNATCGALIVETPCTGELIVWEKAMAYTENTHTHKWESNLPLNKRRVNV